MNCHQELCRTADSYERKVFPGTFRFENTYLIELLQIGRYLVLFSLNHRVRFAPIVF